MCGIAGSIGKRRIDGEAIRRALDSMANRGPDALRHKSIEVGSNFVNLLHGRLSILDLDERSHQPFSIGPCTMVFNGEIYNFVELKSQLEKQGESFSTTSDTEVLLKYYLRYGDACVEHFEGMWAFAIYDERTGNLLLSRDRFAEKPLYFFEDSDTFYFASEIKTLQRLTRCQFEVNNDHILRYIVNGHKSLYKTDQTFFHGINEVPFASNFKVGLDLSKEVKAYWTPSFNPKPMSRGEAVEGARHHLIQSMKIRLRSDVPLAFCLSGGVDSASLVSIAAKEFNAQVNTFSIVDIDHRYDESDNIEATIEDTGCESTKIVLDPNADNISRLENLVGYHDAPVATISYFIHSLLSEQIAANGYKISISGTAADELFTGYYDHYVLHLFEMRNHLRFAEFKADWEKWPLQFARHPDFRKFDLYFDNPDKRDHIYLNNNIFRSVLKRDFVEPFTETKYSDCLLRNRMMNELFHEVVRVILHEDDLNSMKYSIENRSPFLDKNLFEFAYSIPNEHLINHGYNKSILREAMAGILNDKVRLSREKKGFNASINSIFDFDNPDHIDYFLSDGPIFDLIDREKMTEMFRLKEYPNSYKKFLFNFINSKIFLEQQISF